MDKTGRLRPKHWIIKVPFVDLTIRLPQPDPSSLPGACGRTRTAAPLKPCQWTPRTREIFELRNDLLKKELLRYYAKLLLKLEDISKDCQVLR